MSERASRVCSVVVLLACGCSPEAQGPAPSATYTGAALSRAPACNAGGAGRKNHFGVYHPATATFTLENRRPGWNDISASETSFVYGNQGLTPLIGDWDGNGTETVGIWNAGTFALRNSNTSGFGDVTFNYGNSTDVPLAGDWIGQGKTTVGVWRQGWWYLRNSNTTGVADISFPFGNADDVPVVGDWDGDGKDTIGVFRNGTWYLRNTNSDGPADIVLGYGDPGMIPVVGDWDEDGVDTVGAYANGTLFLRNSNTTGIGDIAIPFGSAGDVPLAGNWGTAGDDFSATPAVLNGFFPLAADMQPVSSFQHWKDLGMNTLIRQSPLDTIDAWTAGANNLGLKMIRGARPNPADDNNETNLIAWTYQDEIDAQGLPAVPGVHTAYTTYHAVNPRPFMINFSGQYVQGVSNDTCNGPGDGSNETCYPSFIANEDWVSHDIYPVAYNNGDIPILGRTLDKLRRWAGERPQFAYVELTAINGQPQPTPDQVRAEIWSAIVHGARGLSYFPHGGCDPCQTNDGVPADVATEVASQNATITNLASILQGTINPAGCGVDAPAPLDAGWRLDGHGATYVIVVNVSGSTVSNTISLCGVTPTAPISVYGENRVIGGAGMPTFMDSFSPYARHIYVVR